MAIKKYTISSSIEPLANAIRDTGIFKTVTFEVISGGAGEVKCYDINNVCRFSYSVPNNDPTNYATIKWTLDSGEEISLADGNSRLTLNIALSCSNGLLFGTSGSGSSNTVKAALTKTNNDSPCIIFSTGTSANCASIKIIACDDITPISSFSYTDPTSTLRNQVSIVPFSTNADIDHTSYTPTAGYMPCVMYNKPGYGKLINGTDVYITDGYWCIYDEDPLPTGY